MSISPKCQSLVMYTTNNICVSKTDGQLGEDGEACLGGGNVLK